MYNHISVTILVRFFLMVTKSTIYRVIDANPIGPKLSADVFAGFNKMRYL